MQITVFDLEYLAPFSLLPGDLYLFPVHAVFTEINQ